MKFDDVVDENVQLYSYKDEDIVLLFCSVSKASCDMKMALNKFKKVVAKENRCDKQGSKIEIDGVKYQVESVDDSYSESLTIQPVSANTEEVRSNILRCLVRLNLTDKCPEWYVPLIQEQSNCMSTMALEDEDEGTLEALFEEVDNYFYFYLWE